MSLKDKTIWVTRPEKQALALVKGIEQAGGRAFVLPVMEILPKPTTPKTRQLAQDLGHFQHVIFLSTNAVEYGLRLMAPYWPQWPVDIEWWAVGKATAKAMQYHGIEVQIPEHNFNSEGLLAMASLKQAQDQAVLIVRGGNGRALLADTLQSRGAAVSLLEVYKRTPVRPSEEQAQQLKALFANKQLNAVVITSVEILENMVAIGAKNNLNLREIPLIVISQRIADAALKLGFSAVKVASSSDNHEIIAALA